MSNNSGSYSSFTLLPCLSFSLSSQFLINLIHTSEMLEKIFSTYSSYKLLDHLSLFQHTICLSPQHIHGAVLTLILHTNSLQPFHLSLSYTSSLSFHTSPTQPSKHTLQGCLMLSFHLFLRLT